jgi:Ti-type conjugative transfer relaxase TraA
VAIYHFQVKIVGRGQGRGVVAAAAYRAAECLFDHELGRSQNYSAKTGVIHSQILLPEGAPSRWLDRETLWNEVAASEVRKTGEQRKSQLAREIEIALPRELTQAEAIRLAQDFVREQFVGRGMVADLNVHWGTAADGGAQPHAHVLLTMRRVDPLGSRQERIDGRQAERRRRRHSGGSRRRAPNVAGDPGPDPGAGVGSDREDPRGARRDPDYPADDPDPTGSHRAAARVAQLIAAARLRPGLQQHSVVAAAERAGFGLKERAWNDRGLLGLWRERWAEMANARLVELGHDMRIDHRSNAARGLELEAQNKIGPAAARRARQGEDGERTAEHRAIARRNGERLLADPALALEALTQQQSTFTRVDLARLVHRQSDGAEQFAAVMAKVGAAPELVRVGEDGRGRMRFSTRELVQVERQMIGGAVALTRRTTHRVDEQRRTAALAGTQLSEEQHLAYLHVTRSRDLAVVVGIAGGGKSTMLGMARAAWAGQGYRVRGAALAGIAAESLEGSAGIESRTIASWEYAWDQGRELLTAADVLVVDEGGMIGSHQLGRLVARVQQAGAKLVLVGDAEQLQAIEAGAAFRAIADQVGVVAITEPRRQLQEWQRQATKELATARSADALRRYEAAGMVHGHATREAARDGVIAGWDAARRQSPSHSRIILAHERADVQALNEAARAVRRAAGELGPDHALQAEIGVRAFATGDRLYFLRNERGLGVKNGTLGTVERIEFGPNGARLTVRLDRAEGAGTGREVSFDLAEYADIDHGYAATIHKNQGVTVDHAHVLATAAMDRHLI